MVKRMLAVVMALSCGGDDTSDLHAMVAPSWLPKCVVQCEGRCQKSRLYNDTLDQCVLADEEIIE